MEDKRMPTPTPDNETDLLSTDELVDRDCVARRLGVDVRTVSRMVARGELPRPCLGEGGRPRWLWQYVVDFLRKRHEQQAKIDARTRKKVE